MPKTMAGRLGLVHHEGVDGRQELQRGKQFFWSGHVSSAIFLKHQKKWKMHATVIYPSDVSVLCVILIDSIMCLSMI